MKDIPGPKGKPIVGSSLDFAKNPPHFFVNLYREYGELTHFRLGFIDAYLLASPELVQEVLIEKAKHFEKSQRGRERLSKFLGNGLVTSIGEFHKHQRKLIQPAFRQKYLNGYSEAMLHYTDALKEKWQDGKQVDLSEDMMELTMHIVCKTLFDLEVSEQSKQVGEAIMELQEITKKDLTAPFNTPTYLPFPTNFRRKKLLAVVYDILEDMIQSYRKRELPEDSKAFHLMTALLDASREEGLEPMEDRQLRDELLTLFVAGHETTSNALSWTWYELSRHPEIEARFHQELDEVLQGEPVSLEHLPKLTYTTMIFKEAMRLYPPAWSLVGRESQEEQQIGDYMIPKRGLLFISPYVLHRLEKYFPEPETFRPERFTPENEKQLPRHLYIPFGTGHRICIGRSFAMMEGILLLASIGQKFRFKRLSDKEAEILPQITMSIKGGLPVEVQTR